MSSALTVVRMNKLIYTTTKEDKGINVQVLQRSETLEEHVSTVLTGSRRRALAAFGGRGEAGFGASASSSAQTDPRSLGRDDGSREGRGRRGHAGRVRIHPEK